MSRWEDSIRLDPFVVWQILHCSISRVPRCHVILLTDISSTPGAIMRFSSHAFISALDSFLDSSDFAWSFSAFEGACRSAEMPGGVPDGARPGLERPPRPPLLAVPRGGADLPYGLSTCGVPCGGRCRPVWRGGGEGGGGDMIQRGEHSVSFPV